MLDALVAILEDEEDGESLGADDLTELNGMPSKALATATPSATCTITETGCVRSRRSLV